jgi:hypothetical protein
LRLLQRYRADAETILLLVGIGPNPSLRIPRIPRKLSKLSKLSKLRKLRKLAPSNRWLGMLARLGKV